MVAVLVAHGAQQFGRLDEIHIRVGGLPQQPKPPLDYQLVFSVEGLINEYIEPARVIRGGRIVEVESMTEVDQRKLARTAAIDLIKGDQGTNVYYAVVVINTQLFVLQQFTSDKAALTKAIEHATDSAL